MIEYFNNRWLRAIVFLAVSAFSFSPFFLFAQSPVPLSPEGLQRRAAFEFLLGDFAKGKKLEFKGEGDEKILNEIILSTKKVVVVDELNLELPPGSARVASNFRYIVLKGENLDQLSSLTLHPYDKNSHMHVSTKQPKIYRVQMPSLPVPAETMPPMVIKSELKPGGKPVTVTSVAFNSQGRLKAKFDDLAYRNLGAEHPRDKVVVNIGIQRELSVDGHVDLERQKFFRYYAKPGTLDPSFENWAYQRKFYPGRQILKMQPSLVIGYQKNAPKLKESPSKPGHADLTFFDKYDSGGSQRRAISPFKNVPYAMCFDEWPDFMSIPQVGRGTPKVEYFNAAAKLTAAIVADEIVDGGRSAAWWEVKNESTIKSEWDYHYREQNAWSLLADLHNRVAEQIHSKAPGTKVGGPTSAWMQVQVGDFRLYRNQTQFMDETKSKLDFYSHHFYEGHTSLGAWERLKTGYDTYLLGRMEAILNMFRAHMHGTDNVKPILITECGSLQPGRGPSDYWLRMRSYSAYLHKMLQRPHEIGLGVPFIFLEVPWNPLSGDAAFIPKGEKRSGKLKKSQATPLVHFFDLWSDFDGRRLPVSFNRRWLDVTAVHQDSTIQIALTNMGGRRLEVDLSRVVQKVPIKSVVQKRLYYLDGEIKYEPSVTHDDASMIPVDVEETTIVSLQLKQPLVVSGEQERQFWYAGETAVKAKDIPKKGLKIEIDNLDKIKHARLIVGVHRDGGLPRPLKGTFNGKPFSMRVPWAKDIKHLFEPISVKLPVELLKTQNTVAIKSIKGLTITSLHIETDR